MLLHQLCHLFGIIKNSILSVLTLVCCHVLAITMMSIWIIKYLISSLFSYTNLLSVLNVFYLFYLTALFRFSYLIGWFTWDLFVCTLGMTPGFQYPESFALISFCNKCALLQACAPAPCFHSSCTIAQQESSVLCSWTFNLIWLWWQYSHSFKGRGNLLACQVTAKSAELYGFFFSVSPQKPAGQRHLLQIRPK